MAGVEIKDTTLYLRCARSQLWRHMTPWRTTCPLTDWLTKYEKVSLQPLMTFVSLMVQLTRLALELRRDSTPPCRPQSK